MKNDSKEAEEIEEAYRTMYHVVTAIFVALILASAFCWWIYQSTRIADVGIKRAIERIF